MAIGVPIVLMLFGSLVTQFYFTSVRGFVVAEGSTELVHRELERLGKQTTGQRNVLLAFGITILLWIAPCVLAIAGADNSAFARGYAAHMPEGVAAMIGACLVFGLPVRCHERRVTRI